MLHGDENSVEKSEKSYEKRATTFIVTLCFLSFNGGVEGICIYPLETIELILPVLVDEYLFCISSQDAFQGGVTGGKGAGN